MKNKIITVEKGIFSGAERLVELIPSATGEGWIYKPGQFITPWEENGHFSARYLTGRDRAQLAAAGDALRDHDYSSWEDPSIIVIAGSVYLATTDNLKEGGGTTLHGIIPARGDDYYRPFWRYGDAEMLIWKSQNPNKWEETKESPVYYE